MVPSKNELPTVRMKYPRAVAEHEYLLNDPEIAFEYFNPDTGEWVEPYDSRLRAVGVDFDYLEEVETRDYTFIGIGEVMKGIYVFEANGMDLNDEGKVQFPRSNPGKMLDHVWRGAVNRGFKGLSKSFNDGFDSAGQPWAQELSVSFSTDTSFDSMLSYFERLGLVDFCWEGRTLHVFNADTALAQDKTTGDNPLRFNLSGGPAGIDSAPESQARDDLATHVVVTGEDGLRWVFPTGITLPEGRREVFLSYSGVDDEGTALIMAGPTIARYSNTLTNTTRQFRLHDGVTILPYRDYGVGDWGLVEKDNGQWERKQIFQTSLLIDHNGVQGYVSLGDKIDSLLERLHERVSRIQGGTVSEGTEPPEPALAPPTPPKGVVVTSQTVPGRYNQYEAVIGINFTHDGKATNGGITSISRFEVMYRVTGTQVWSPLFSIAPGLQAGSYSWLTARKPDGSPMVYDFHIVAVNNRGAFSAPSETVTHSIRQDQQVPEVPETPQVEAGRGTFIVTVEHKRSDGEAHAPDYLHAVVQMSEDSDGPWVDVDTIVPPMTKAYIPADGYYTRYFRILAVDYDGNMSSPSLSAHATTTKVASGDIDVESLLADTGFIGSLRTNILISNSITSDMIQGDAITAKHTLTGPLIRSAAAGARTEMTNQGFRHLDANGAETVKIGYGIDTGIALRNPGTGVLAPVSNLVFGGTTWAAPARVQIALPEGQVGSQSTTVQQMGYTAVSSSAIMFASSNLWIDYVWPGFYMTSNAKARTRLRLVPRRGAAVPTPTMRGTQYAELESLTWSADVSNNRASVSWVCWFEGLIPGEVYDMEIWFSTLDRPYFLEQYRDTANNLIAVQNVMFRPQMWYSTQPACTILPR